MRVSGARQRLRLHDPSFVPDAASAPTSSVPTSVWVVVIVSSVELPTVDDLTTKPLAW